MVSSSGGRLSAVSTAASRYGVYYGIVQRRLSGGVAIRPPAYFVCLTAAMRATHPVWDWGAESGKSGTNATTR